MHSLIPSKAKKRGISFDFSVGEIRWWCAPYRESWCVCACYVRRLYASWSERDMRSYSATVLTLESRVLLNRRIDRNRIDCRDKPHLHRESVYVCECLLSAHHLQKKIPVYVSYSAHLTSSRPNRERRHRLGSDSGLGWIYLFNCFFLPWFSFRFFFFPSFSLLPLFSPLSFSFGWFLTLLLTTTPTPTTITSSYYYYRLRPSFPSDTPATWQYYLPFTTTTTTD